MDRAIEKYQTELVPGSVKNYFTTKSYVKKVCKEKYEFGDVKIEVSYLRLY